MSSSFNDDPNKQTAAGAAAAAPSVNMDDATIAQVLQCMDTLTSFFNFTPEVAQEAIEAVGTDVTLCYNYILDKGLGNDQGGPVVPISDCPHVKNHVKLPVEGLPSPYARCSHGTASSTLGRAKGEFMDDGSCPSGENWICLECGIVGCSRYINGHGLMHYEESLKSEETKGKDGAGHCIAVSLADLSVWCHACSAYLKDPSLVHLVAKLEKLKFGIEGKDKSEEEIEKHEEDEEEGAGIQQESERSSQSSSDDESEEEKQPAALTAPSRGLPLWNGFYSQSDSEEDIEYPFASCPSSLRDVAAFIKSDRCKSIVILAGAGLSTSSGIPDFRSVGGLYDTLQPDLLTASEPQRAAIRMDPTVALNLHLFLENPLPCLELNRPFILGTRDQKWKATLGHRFVELLYVKTGKLTRMYTQNIDGLEGQCEQLPREKVIAVHGSMNEAECARCGSVSDFQEFCTLLERNIKDITGEDLHAPKESQGIACSVCSYQALKPSIVLFRSPLPKVFFQNASQDIPHVDLLIVIGTSLAVAPANSLIVRVPKTAMRVVVNQEPVGFQLGIDYSDEAERDFFAKGDADAVLLDLMVELGWLDDLIPILNSESLAPASAAILKARLDREGKVSTNSL